MTELLWRVFYLVVWAPLARTLVRTRREGPSLPKGPVLLAPNHCSFMDPVVVQGACWRHVSFLMTEIYYRPWTLRWFFAWMRVIPVNEGRRNREALDAATSALRAGWAVAIFPEGQIAVDGKLQRFHPGVASLAAAVGCPVIPVGIVGSYEAFPRHRSFPRLFRKVVVRFGAPIAPPPRDGDEASRKEKLRSFTARVRAGVEELLEPSQLPERAAIATG